MCHESKKQLSSTNALKYIKWGEKQSYHRRPSCCNRQLWWNLGEWKYPTMLWSDAYNNRYAVFVNTGDFYGDKRFFLINTEKEDLMLSLFLNSTITPLFIELQGIINLGQGVIYTNVYWLKRYSVLSDVTRSIPLQKKEVIITFKDLARREIKSIFEELGLPRPNKNYSNIDPSDVSFDNVMPDRRELDKIIFEALGLTKDEQLEVYRAVVELVKNRLVKARSV